MSDEEALSITERLEIANGLRCMGCGRRIVRGFTFVSMAVKEQTPLMKLSACSRDDCGYATIARAGATYVEQVEYVWLDPAGENAPPAAAVVEQNRRIEAARKARESAAAEP